MSNKYERFPKGTTYCISCGYARDKNGYALASPVMGSSLRVISGCTHAEMLGAMAGLCKYCEEKGVTVAYNSDGRLFIIPATVKGDK